MAGICEGRVAVITGAARGIGRGHALEFARQRAKVVVNDLDPEPDVIDAIKSMGGEAVANSDDVSDWEGARRLIATAVETWGRIDVLVNNAGIVRDRMLVSMQEEEWDAVIKVHLKGTAGPMHHAAAHWRDRAKAGNQPDARIINTSSAAGLFGSVGQSNYAAAKAGIAALTRVASAELSRYGVTVNAIAPAARTRMTEEVFAEMMAPPEEGFDRMDPENVAPLVVWLGSPEARDVTGQVFEIWGSKLSVAEGWQPGPEVDKDERWEPADLAPVVADLLARARPSVPVIGS